MHYHYLPHSDAVSQQVEYQQLKYNICISVVTSTICIEKW